MLNIDELKKRDIVLTPFCADSVLLLHRLNRIGIRASMFFDRNPLLENQTYCETIIRRMYYRVDCNVVICKKGGYYDEISESLYAYNYSKNDIYSIEDLDIPVTNYEASEDVDLDLFKNLLPASMVVYTDNSDYLKIKKINKIYELGGPYEGLTYDEFEGLWRKDNYIDANGESHIFIKRFELDVTSKCSLKCKKCGAMMQYFKNPRDIESQVVLADYNKMLQLIEWTDDVLIMGGEPFIYKDLDKVLHGIKENKDTCNKVGMVKIVTNGTIVPNQKVINELKNTDISVMISNYGKYSRKLTELITVFQRENVKYDILHIEKWGNVQQLLDRKMPMTSEELLEKRKKCWKRHHAISEGKFYLCAFSNFSQKLAAVPYNENNFVNLYDKNAKDKIINILKQDQPLPESCSWCNGNFPENWEGDGQIPVAEQSTETLSYRCFKEN